MNTRYYKMANSNLFSNIEIVQYIKQSEEFSNKMIDSFSNAIFSSVVSVLVGMKMWNSMEDCNGFIKIGVAFVTILVLYVLAGFLLKKLMEILKLLLPKKLKVKSDDNKNLMYDYFYTELQPQIVMGLSLAERILSNQFPYEELEYKKKLDKVYIHQCIYYFRKVSSDIDSKHIYTYCNAPRDRIGEASGYYAFYDTCKAVIFQLEKLKNKYEFENERNKEKMENLKDDKEKKLVNYEVKKNSETLFEIDGLLFRYNQFLGLNKNNSGHEIEDSIYKL